VNDLFVADLSKYVLRLGDDALISAQRTAEWIAAAPQLEEDVALGNIGLDQLGQARSLLQYAEIRDRQDRDLGVRDLADGLEDGRVGHHVAPGWDRATCWSSASR
jgi:1,2-phenylacetyl-CoA epoxidase catalytic subunit